ncbi:tautomerase family protein [Sphingomonas profundi]|uniref:tautomerase family protein n=1 Tax=Alterirhizorhabdus profundi TaxID=2681549 RepID=UPI0012E991F3|nr:tautomerase family protein [Sphingomonas profundi]
MPIADIRIATGRPREMIEAMARAVTRTIVETLGAPVESVRVVVTEVEPHSWFAGGVSLAERAEALAARQAAGSAETGS